MTQRILITMTMVLAIAGTLAALGHYANLRLGTRDCKAADNTHIYKPGREEVPPFFGRKVQLPQWVFRHLRASGVESLYERSADASLDVVRLIAWRSNHPQNPTITVITLTPQTASDYRGYASKLIEYELEHELDRDESKDLLVSNAIEKRSLRLREAHVEQLNTLLKSRNAWATCKLPWRLGHYYFFVEQVHGGVYRMAIRPSITIIRKSDLDSIIFPGDVVRDPETGQRFHDRGALWYARFHHLFRELNGGSW